MNDERESTSEERWRDAFTPEAREERRQQGEKSRRQRTAAISKALGKRDTKVEVNDE